MSWLFSRALVAEFSVANCLDGEQSAQSSGESTPLAYCAPDRMKAFSRLSRFGVTFKPLTENLGADVLTLYLAAFPVRTSALPEKAQESTASGPGCGATWLGSLGKYDPASRSWKTAQRSFLGDLEESLVTWPRSGMTAAGECWELPMLEPITSGTVSGLWPTPTVCGNYNRKGASATSGDGLATAVKLWATPCARDFRYPGKSWMERTGGKQGEVLPQMVGGPLNPPWVEWLMGWPLGWTDLKPSVTDKSPSALQQHGECLEGQ